jgi:D-alanyl-D-alanine carboxypeptidase/D-alanyl-D-alanine-endopeptidase (penicillin-binding protein 4)
LRRHSGLASASIAVLCAFTMAAGITVSRLLPARLALWQVPRIAATRLPGSSAALAAATGSASGGAAATPAGVTRAITPIVGSPVLGSRLGVLVTDLATGQVLYSRNAAVGFAPASTTKLATSIAALQVLGPSARFRTKVVAGPSNAAIVLVGGGDPTLAAGAPPASDYPPPATLLELARQTAAALRARGRHSVGLSYDTSLYSGSGLAPGWPLGYVSTGNVSIITPLEADQGRVTRGGAPADNEASGGQRSADPAALAAASFARFLAADGIGVRSAPTPATASPHDRVLASVQSPPLSAIVGWMLEESNNVIAENLARHVAIATGRPASFSGAAEAVTATLHGLGVTGEISLADGSGLSPDDRLSPAVLVQLIRLAAGRAQLRSVLTGLPVEGFSGTLALRGSVFGLGGRDGFGVVRAKTGNLSTVAALAGTAYAKDGQLLAFAIMADKIAQSGLPNAATTMVDLASTLAGCGCR